MDAIPPPYSDMPASQSKSDARPLSNTPSDDERRTEFLLDALKTAIAASSEQRLFRSGKLAGLFPARVGLSAEAALVSLQTGLLEIVRSEIKGKVVTEWVKATPRGVDYLHENDSPRSVLREMKAVLQATQSGIPVWMEDARREIAETSARFESKASLLLKQLSDLTERVEAALRRTEMKTPTVTDSIGQLVPWALEALAYLDRRKLGGAVGNCLLPELFRALRVWVPTLALADFQDGIRRLHDARVLKLVSSDEIAEPEYAVVVDGKLMSAVGR